MDGFKGNAQTRHQRPRAFRCLLRAVKPGRRLVAAASRTPQYWKHMMKPSPQPCGPPPPPPPPSPPDCLSKGVGSATRGGRLLLTPGAPARYSNLQDRLSHRAGIFGIHAERVANSRERASSVLLRQHRSIRRGNGTYAPPHLGLGTFVGVSLSDDAEKIIDLSLVVQRIHCCFVVGKMLGVCLPCVRKATGCACI